MIYFSHQQLEAASFGQAVAHIAQQSLEVTSYRTSMAKISQQSIELLLSSFGLKFNQLSTELAVQAKKIARNSQQCVEVLWLETSAAVLPFSQDWQVAVTESLQFKTQILTSMNGVEQRIAQKAAPRLNLSLNLTLGNQDEARHFVQWLNLQQGKAIDCPLPQHAICLSQAHARLSTTLNLGADIDFFNAVQPLGDKLQGEAKIYGAGALLALHARGYEVLQGEFNPANRDEFLIDTPLQRGLPAGTKVMPLVRGVALENTSVSHMAGGLINVKLDVACAPMAHSNDLGQDMPSWNNSPVFTDDYLNAGALDNSLQSDFYDSRAWEFAATIDQIQSDISKPYYKRRNDASAQVFNRRYWLKRDALDLILRAIYSLKGRQNACWISDGLTGLNLRTPAAANTSTLYFNSVLAASYLPFSGLLWVKPQGSAPFIMPFGSTHSTAEVGGDGGGADVVMQLSQVLPVDLNTKTEFSMLNLVRLNSDKIDFIWHHANLIELNLAFASLASLDYRLQTQGDYTIPPDYNCLQ